MVFMFGNMLHQEALVHDGFEIAFSGKRAEETPIKLLWQGSPPV